MAGQEKIKYDKSKENESLSFEKAIERLEEIVAALDQNHLPLDQALDRFQEGIELVRYCNNLLNLAETRVRMLLESGGETDEDKKEEVAPK